MEPRNIPRAIVLTPGNKAVLYCILYTPLSPFTHSVTPICTEMIPCNNSVLVIPPNPPTPPPPAPHICFVVVLFGFWFGLLPLTFDNNVPSFRRKCICNYHSSVGNTQISILLLCFLYLFVEFMITMYEYILV